MSFVIKLALDQFSAWDFMFGIVTYCVKYVDCIKVKLYAQ